MNVRSILIPFFTVLSLVTVGFNPALSQECDSEPKASIKNSVQAFFYNHRKILAACTLLVGCITGLYHKDAIGRLFGSLLPISGDQIIRDGKVDIINVRTLLQPNATDCHWRTVFNFIKFNEYLKEHNGCHDGYISSITESSFKEFVDSFRDEVSTLKTIPNTIVRFLISKHATDQNAEELDKFYFATMNGDSNPISKKNYSLRYPWASAIVPLFSNNKIPSVQEWQKAIDESAMQTWLTEKIKPFSASFGSFPIKDITTKDIYKIAETIKMYDGHLLPNIPGTIIHHLTYVCSKAPPDVCNSSTSKDDISLLYYDGKAKQVYISNVFNQYEDHTQHVRNTLSRDDIHSLFCFKESYAHWFFGAIQKSNDRYKLYMLDSLSTGHSSAEPEIKTIVQVLNEL